MITSQLMFVFLSFRMKVVISQAIKAGMELSMQILEILTQRKLISANI